MRRDASLSAGITKGSLGAAATAGVAAGVAMATASAGAASLGLGARLVGDGEARTTRGRRAGDSV